MANFKIPEDGEDIHSFDLPTGRKVTLLQWGGDAGGNKLKLAVDSGVSLDVLPTKLPAASTAFTLESTVPGAVVRVSAVVDGTTQKYSSDLVVNVKGKPKKHVGYDFDLISNLAITGNAKDIRNYSQMMVDPEPLLGQNTAEGHYNCGDVSASYGSKLFHKPTSVTYNAYYLKPTSKKMEDLRFNPDQMRNAIGRIRNLLRQGTSVRVWLIHDDGFGSVIQSTDATHFVTIVGCGGNNFLYIDPWPGGSRFPYDGGMYPPRRAPRTFFGQFEFDPTQLELGIRNSPASRGSMPYTVIAGP
ncbi:MAG: hypothetical protein ACTHNN_01995 [Xanthobacteraceae bacterium]